MPKKKRDLVLVYDPDDGLAFFSTLDSKGQPLSLTAKENDWQITARTLPNALGQARMDGFEPTHRLVHREGQKNVAFSLSGAGH